MKAFYELDREDNGNLCVSRNNNYEYPAHFHDNVELLVVRRGRQEVTCNGKSYVVTDGTIAFFDEYDVHSYAASVPDGDRDDCMLVIPARLLDVYRERKHGRRVGNPILPDPHLADVVLEMVDRFCLSDFDADEYQTAAWTDLLMSILYPHLQLVQERARDESALIRKILMYIREHYRMDVTLSKIAEYFGYTEAYLSRTFHRYLRTGVPDYINRMRLEYVDKHYTKECGKKLTEIIFEAGFQSQQTYYRTRRRQREEEAAATENKN